MSLEAALARHTDSAPSSGRSSPVPRATRRTVEDGLFKADKNLKRYAAIIERALSSWEISPEEWADYIAFLGRLLKSIQAHPKDASILPHGEAISTRLAQCLNPALPSGVHQKALEVYRFIFATFGNEHIATHLHEYLPGLSGVLSFASSTVRPGLYSLFEDYIVLLPTRDLRPCLKAIILCLLPALEEETGEDFERAFNILQTLQKSFIAHNDSHASVTPQEADGYFWQCLFLTVITSPSRRQGALNYLSRRLPQIASPSDAREEIPGPAQSVVSPEPGLLVRCFICGLTDSQLLIQRGFLDLLVSHLPLKCNILQEKVGAEDLDRLVSAAMQVLLRRDMSLNRRLWNWFLGPEQKDQSGDSQAYSPVLLQQNASANPELSVSAQLRYFLKYGQASLKRCVIKMLQNTDREAGHVARPFRICLSLMDRWEIGGMLVPQVFLPAIKSLFEYSQHAISTDVSEVVRSASLFFDGVEASLIWEALVETLRAGFEDDGQDAEYAVRLFTWTVETFNVKDEEMLTIHIPNAMLYLLSSIDSIVLATEVRLQIVLVTNQLLDMLPSRIFQLPKDMPSHTMTSSKELSSNDGTRKAIIHYYENAGKRNGKSANPFNERRVYELLISTTVSITTKSLNALDKEVFPRSTELLLALVSKNNAGSSIPFAGELEDTLTRVFDRENTTGLDRSTVPFPIVSSAVSLVMTLSEGKWSPSSPSYEHLHLQNIAELRHALVFHLWCYMLPAFPKYQVEAVKVFWQLDESTTSDDNDSLLISLAALVRGGAQKQVLSTNLDGRLEAVRRFTVLWGHTVPPTSSKLGAGRRASGLSVLTDTQQQARALQVLEAPLFLILDELNFPSTPPSNFIRSWLQGLSSLEQIFLPLFKRLIPVVENIDRNTMPAGRSDVVTRQEKENLRDANYVFGQFLNLLAPGSAWTWQCISRMTVGGVPGAEETGALLLLADFSVRLLCSERHNSEALNRRLIDILELVLTSPVAIELRPLELDSILLDKLLFCISSTNEMSGLQTGVLKLVQLALKSRLVNKTREPPPLTRTRRGGSISSKRPSISLDSRPNTSASTSSFLAPSPPAQLFSTIRTGFSSPNTRYHLDQWLAFLADILPSFADAIFTNLLPLVECFSNQLSVLLREMITLSRKHEIDEYGVTIAPEAVAVSMLDGLEMVLDRAYDCLMNENGAEPTTKENELRPSFLANVTSGVFKAEGPPSRTTKSNNRLTVILALQDSIRTALQIWLWASNYITSTDLDHDNTATTAYHALKVRNKTRNLLEQIFSVEPLESLEVIIAHWRDATQDSVASSSLRLLHVMQVSRPKNIVPATLDALCSRTNPTAIPQIRNSSLTVDLASGDVATFFSAYLHSIEDDAMDEVWPDCVAFLRDVLANPLPYRQVLPHLLSIVLLLAEKLSNTNFGDQRKMRRDLGDIFLRLLTATFTTLPAGHISEAVIASEEKHEDGDRVGNGSGRHYHSNEGSMMLIPVLNRTVGKFDLILENSERISTAVGNITTNLLVPVLKARSFPKNVNNEFLELMLQMARIAPGAKNWKKELADAFNNDHRLLASSQQLMVRGWFPLLQQWTLHDKEQRCLPELLSRLAPPSTAGIMFGVGASAARLEADRKTQYNLRRICLLLLASPEDNNTFIAHLRPIEEKLAELFAASPSSSPSATIKAELFMLCRTLALSVSALHLSPLWPTINAKLQSALMCLLPNNQGGNNNPKEYNNLSLLQACKLLDLLIALSPDEFQLHEWLYITDTIDAVYQPADWSPASLSDQVSEALGSTSMDDADGSTSNVPSSATVPYGGRRRPLLGDNMALDRDDIKALPREDFVRAILRPFLSQLSIHAYEGVYSMDTPDVEALRRSLLADLLDLGSIVE